MNSDGPSTCLRSNWQAITRQDLRLLPHNSLKSFKLTEAGVCWTPWEVSIKALQPRTRDVP
jgi:hypothetical protein